MAYALCLSPRRNLLPAGAKRPVSIDWIIDGVWVPIHWKPDVAGAGLRLEPPIRLYSLSMLASTGRAAKRRLSAPTGACVRCSFG
jgi:hypothetical protein